MTAKEAIAYLEDPFSLSLGLTVERRLKLHNKAVNMAIEALKAQDAKDAKPMSSQLPSGDTIYRQDAIVALHDEIVRRRISEDTNDDGALDEFDTEAILRRLPSAQTKPCEDAVSRADAFNAINDYVNKVGVLDGYTDTQEVLRIVKSLPSAQPEKRTEERTEMHSCD